MQSVFLATQRERCFANKQYDTTTWPPAVSTVRPVTDDMLTSAACFKLNETLNDSDSPPAEMNLCLHHRMPFTRDHVLYEV